jgi:glycosyltransferase involved in cell wall biosynthesis
MSNLKFPQLSIVTACYNAAPFIGDLFKSLVCQDYQNWELVIIDDCSTDNSIETIKLAIKAFDIEGKVNLLTQNKNRGYGYTLWNAIRHSRGPLIAVVDADDALAGHKALSETVKTHNKYPDVALTYSDYIECNNRLEQRSVYHTRQLKSCEQYINTKIRLNHLKCFKRSFYDATEGVNKKLRRSVDKDLVLKFEEVGRLLYIPTPLYLYRKHRNGVSRTDHKKGKEYIAQINRTRKQIYEDAWMRRQQSLTWLNPEKCQALQNKWGNYNSFGKCPNQGNKKDVIKVLKQVISTFGKEKPSVLDVGCGAGHFMWVIKDRVSKLIGLDFSPEMLKLTRKQFAKTMIIPELLYESCWKIPLPDNSVDIVYQVDVAMHIGGSWESIQEMMRVSRKYIIFTGPSFESNLTTEMDMPMGSGKRWAVSIPLLKRKLGKLESNGEIKSYDFRKRVPTSVYNHKILVIEKPTECPESSKMFSLLTPQVCRREAVAL